jgi:hypothetical protein
MKDYHSQNLNENGSMFWQGRAWFAVKRNRGFRWEWYLGKYARQFSAYISLGNGDCDDELTLHLCLPFLFSIYFSIGGVIRLKASHKTGISIHDSTFYIYPFTNEHEWSRDMPWWEKSIFWSFPWDYRHHSTEVLEHKANLPYLAATVFTERRGDGGLGNRNFDRKQKWQKSVSETYDYTYTLKSGNVQHRKATVYVDRMTWRMRWWPLLPFKKISTCINVDFNDEVGEGTGSWKGGTTGCGYEMLVGETPLDCLRRMERERKFGR